MKRPLVGTLLMGAVALVTVAAAAFYYPWRLEEEGVEQRRDFPLFESLDTSQVRGIRIVQFDRTTRSLDEFVVRRSANDWVIPARSDYLAGNTLRIAALLSMVREMLVLDTVSDVQKDHELYAVGEPDQAQAQVSAATGTLVVLEDRNRRPIASLVVGNAPGDDPGKRFVRVVGQPQVYLVDFNAAVLSTRFQDWIDPNLFRLPLDSLAAQGAQQRRPSPLDLIRTIAIDNYYIDVEELEKTPPARRDAYRAQFERPSDGTWTGRAWRPSDQGQIDESTEPVELELPAPVADALSRQLVIFNLSDVRRKDDLMAEALAAPETPVDSSAFASAPAAGFAYRGPVDGQHQFDAAAGHSAITTTTGLRYHIYFGAIAGIDSAGTGQIERLAMITADVDPAAFPEPTAPSADGTAEEQEARQREFQRQVEERATKLAEAQRRAHELNQIHAQWYYVVGEDVVAAFQPDWATLNPP